MNQHSKDTNMKRIENHPAFYYLIALVGIGLALAVTGCITVRQSGAHDTTINIVGDSNGLSMVAHRESSDQDASAEPKLSAVGDEALKTAGKTAAAIATGGASTLPQAAAKIAEKK